MLIGIALLLQRTRIGKAMRAVADNRDLAASSGIDVERVVRFVWALGGGALAALGGVLYALSELGGRVQWEMGFKLLLLMFAGITLGGLGTAYGAARVRDRRARRPAVHPGDQPDLKYIGGLLILIVILVIRPQGILGSRARIG